MPDFFDVTICTTLGFAEAADGMKAGKIEAAFFSSGLPNSSLMELEQGLDLQIVTIDQDKLKEIIAAKPYFKTFAIPAGTYGNETDVPTAAIMNALLVSSDLSEADGYKLTKALFDNLIPEIARFLYGSEWFS